MRALSLLSNKVFYNFFLLLKRGGVWLLKIFRSELASAPNQKVIGRERIFFTYKFTIKSVLYGHLLIRLSSLLARTTDSRARSICTSVRSTANKFRPLPNWRARQPRNVIRTVWTSRLNRNTLMRLKCAFCNQSVQLRAFKAIKPILGQTQV